MPPDAPSDLWFRAPDGGEHRLTHIHATLLAERHVIIPQEIRYSAPDGLEIQGWLLYPPGFDPTGKFPLAVFIHGGPHTMWGPSFRTLWPDWQGAAGHYLAILGEKPDHRGALLNMGRLFLLDRPSHLTQYPIK